MLEFFILWGLHTLGQTNSFKMVAKIFVQVFSAILMFNAIKYICEVIAVTSLLVPQMDK